MTNMTSRVIVALGAATIIACSHDNPAAPSDVRYANDRPTTEPLFAASFGHTLASVPILDSFGVNATGVTSVRLFLGFPDIPIFDEVLHGSTHRMLVAGPSTPGFDTIVAKLTDQERSEWRWLLDRLSS